MPTAISTDKARMDLFWNSDPMKTISADMPTSSTKVFIRLAVGCQVIYVLLERFIRGD